MILVDILDGFVFGDRLDLTFVTMELVHVIDYGAKRKLEGNATIVRKKLDKGTTIPCRKQIFCVLEPQRQTRIV